MRLLQERADQHGDNTVRSLAASIAGDLSQMREILESFRYFRVRIGEGTISDVGDEAHAARLHESEPTVLVGVSVAEPGAAVTRKERPRHD